MKNKVLIKVNYSNYFYNYLITKSIKYSDLHIKNDMCYLCVNIDEYNYLSKLFDIKIIRYYGINFFKFFLKNNIYFIISIFISFLLLSILCNTIFNINVICDNDILKEEILIYLNKNGIKEYKKKKDYLYISTLKEDVVKKFNNIDWIEINEIGCKYEVDIIEKKIGNNRVNDKYGDIIASKDGLIKHIVVYNGTKIKEENEYVKKGDIIVSGNISYNDTNIKNTLANAEIFAEVWYTAKITVPLKYKEYVKSNKKINRYYLEIFNKEFIITGNYEPKYTFKEKECILNKPYLFFKLYKETIYEYTYNDVVLNKNDARNIGIEKANKYINDLLDLNEYIISKKVLKYDENSSKINIEVFYKVYENIAETLYY